MRVVLLAPYPEQLKNVSTTQYPPLGILYVGAAIKDLASDLLILDANVLKLSEEETLGKVLEFKPDIVGISINIVTAGSARSLAVRLRATCPDLLLVAGGPLPTAAPQEWLQHFNLVIRGEGELAFRHILTYWRFNKDFKSDFPGICYPNGPITMAEHPDLDQLPFPAYDKLVPSLPYYSRKARIIRKNMASILTSRGCPYGCIFCDKSVHGSNFRPRSAESVLKEIRWLYDTYHVRQLDILDDNFTFHTDRAMKILEGVIKIGKFAINCQNGIRADRLNEELVRKMKQAGVFRVGIGVESGKPEIISMLKKRLDLADVTKAIAMFRKQRITVHGYFIIGFPFESREDILATIDFAKKLNPHYANFTHFMPIIGTPIYQQLDQENRILGNKGEFNDGFYRMEAQIKNSLVGMEEMKALYTRAWRSFYLRPGKVLDVILSIKSLHEFRWVAGVGVEMLRHRLLEKQ